MYLITDTDKYLITDPLAMGFEQGIGEAQLHVRTCATLFHILRTVVRILWCVVIRDPLAMHFPISHGWGTPEHALMHIPFLYLMNVLTDCVWLEIH